MPSKQEQAEATPTILLLNDNEALRTCLQGCLEDAGYGVVTAGDRLDALAQLQAMGTRLPASSCWT